MATTTEPPRDRRRRRLGRGSARGRILASYVVLLAVSTLASVLVTRELLLRDVDSRVDAALDQELSEFRRLVADGRNPATGKPFGDDLASVFDVYLSRNVPARGEQILTFLDGRLYAAPSGASGGARLRNRPELARVSRTRRAELATPAGLVRYLAVPVRDTTGRRRGVFLVAAQLELERDEVEDAVRIVAGVLLGVLLLASGVAWVVAGRVLAPLRTLTETARTIGETDLTRRIDVRGEDEVATLGRTFNGMLDRLESAFGSQRAFINDAAHELRTPITIVRGHLELLGDDPEERRETIALVTDELDRMTGLVEELLTLARADRQDFLRPAPIALDRLGDELLAKARALAPERAWTLDERADGELVADRKRLTQAVVQLAANAVAHTPADRPVHLGLRAEPDVVALWVRDEGPGVPADQADRIFERFARAPGPRRTEGSGLGLAIVRAIAEAHGGRALLDHPAGGGARFTVEVPR